MTSDTTTAPSTWTWADQVSSWRFWGLLIFYVSTVSSANAALDIGAPFFIQAAGLSTEQYSYMILARQIAAGAGFGLSWVAVKWRPHATLVILAVLELCGLALIQSFLNSAPLWTTFAGWVMVGLSTGAIILAVPAIVAGGRGGAEAFLVSIGVISALGAVGKTIATFAMGMAINSWGSGTLIYLVAIPATLGALALISVDKRLFTGQVPSRGYPLTPRARRPIVTALLILFVPFYVVYWLYRIHGEVIALAPSPILLSPRGALFCTLFVPFLPFIAMASLIEALNTKRREQHQPPLRSPVTIYLWALFFPPAAGFMIQSDLNRMMLDQPEPMAP